MNLEGTERMGTHLVGSTAGLKQTTQHPLGAFISNAAVGEPARPGRSGTRRAAQPVRVALVDGDAGMHERLQAHLAAAESGWRLESYQSSREALRGIPGAPPHLVLLGQTLPDGCGIACAQQLKARVATLPVMLLAASGCPDKLQRALLAGVTGYVVKPCASPDLVTHLRKALAGRFTMCEQAERLLPRAFARFGVGNQWGLSRREEEVLRCVCRNLCDKEVATELKISDETVHVHLRNAFKKLGVQGRKAAILKFLGAVAGGG